MVWSQWCPHPTSKNPHRPVAPPKDSPSWVLDSLICKGRWKFLKRGRAAGDSTGG